MYIHPDHKELVQLSIAIVVGIVFLHQSSFIIPVIAQTSQNNLTSDNPFPKLHEIKIAVV